MPPLCIFYRPLVRFVRASGFLLNNRNQTANTVKRKG